MVLELLASSTALLACRGAVHRWMESYGVDVKRRVAGRGREARPRASRIHHVSDEFTAETVAQPVKVDKDLYVRDYARCILCYRCVEGRGEDA